MADPNSAEPFAVRWRSRAGDRAGLAAEADQRAGLHGLQRDDACFVGTRRFGRQIECLAAGHAAHSRGSRQAGDKFEPRRRGQRRLRGGDDVEGKRQQAVSGKDGGGLVECPVNGRLAAPEIVVVHCRQVVVDEGIAVHAFKRRRDPRCVGTVRVEQRRAFHDQKWPQPLAAVENAVPHGGQQLGRPRNLAGADAGRQQPVEQRLDLGGASGQGGFERGAFRRPASSRAFTGIPFGVKDCGQEPCKPDCAPRGVGRCTSCPGRLLPTAERP